MKVNNTPKVGTIAQRNKGAGHVACVTAVNAKTKMVSVEEYNFDHQEAYGTRTVKWAASDNYIHWER